MSQTFNPLSGQFDELSDLRVTSVGAVPNANGATVVQSGADIALTLQVADLTHPGVVPNIGAANGVASLDSAGHIPLSQLPPTLIEYQGTWDASTNTPTLSNASGVFNVSGYFFIVSTGGTVNFGAGPITFNSGDWVLFNGTIWERAVQSNIVQSVNGQTGVVTVNAINQLTGDATAGPASGSQSAALTLATVNGNVGTFGTATQVGTFTVNAKGLITAASNTSIQIAESQVTNLVSDLAGKQPTGNYITALTGDATASGPGSAALTLTTVNANVGTFTYATITVNAKGLITAASSGAAPTGTVTSVSVVSANGLAGTVATSTTTPAITLSTTITGILQGNGTAISAATTTGTGSVVLATSPTLVTPNLGTPSTLTLTNATGLPLSTGVTGTLAATNFPALTGDVTTTAGSLATTLATVNANVGSFTNANITVNAKGLITAASNGTSGSGTVTSVSVVSANGLAGTVATTTTTPAITLSTTITGILQGNGTAISAATTTGTGSVVLSASPTLTGTIAAAALTLTTPLVATSGGTGTGTYTTGDTLYASATNTLSKLPIGTTGQYYVVTGGVPAWSSASPVAFVAPTVQLFTSGSGTYTTPTSPRTPLYIKIRMIGGGGGGGANGGAGSTSGGNTTFSTLTANGGPGGATTVGSFAAGGTATGGDLNITGGDGGAAVNAATIGIGGPGGNSFYGGGGQFCVDNGGNNINGRAGTAAGSGGGGNLTVTAGGGGGAAGGYCEKIITSPTATYSYAVGAAGAGGTGGTGSTSGGAGVSGRIRVEEYYQ